MAHAYIDSFYIDYSPISFPIPVNELYYSSFSLNDSLLALSLIPNGNPDSVFDEVWIYAVYGSRSSPVKVIDFQKDFCTYNFKLICAEFLTDSTLAVSMHKDGDTASLLWEITIDGRIVRQLTFMPEHLLGVASVTPQSVSFTINPNPASGDVTISLPSGNNSTVEIYDVLGNLLLRRQASGEFVWNPGAENGAANGAYIVRVTGQGADGYNFVSSERLLFVR